MDKYGVDVSDEHLRAIGRITVYFALLEQSISSLIWSLISGDQRLGHIITAELSFGSLLPLLNSLYEHRGNPEKRDELEALIKKADEARKKRNSIIHSFWLEGKTPETIIRLKMTARKREGIQYQFQKFNIKDLAEIADFIAELGYEIDMFHTRMLNLNLRWGG